MELDAERAAVAAASGIATVHGNLFDTSAGGKLLFLYLNPRYDSEIGSMGNERMEYLFPSTQKRRSPADVRSLHTTPGMSVCSALRAC